ncbi:MAG: RDD family protein [Candidatus Nanopelagicaceae bacterium]|jgi:uncharacterized RDD family membrane protein YckC
MNLYPKASIQHRLGGYFLDLALALVTLGIGWVIWSLVVWRNGLTPAKQILKMRVVAEESRTNATWGHMAIRQFLIPVTFSIPGWLLLQLGDSTPVVTDGFSSDPLEGEGLSTLGNVLSFAITLIDGLWIFKDGQRKRVTDLWAKTIVVNEAEPITGEIRENGNF